MRTRAEQHEDVGACLMLRRDFAAEEIAVDIELLARHLGLEREGGGQWFNYVLPEQEVIVRNADHAVKISPRDVARSWHGDDIGKLWDPAIGETFQDGDRIERRVEEFLGSDECGNAIVRSGDVRYQMDCHSGFWFVTGTTPILARPSPEHICEFQFQA